MQQWFLNNLDVTLYIYGLTLLLMGLIIHVQPKEDSQFKLANILWLFVAYALVHFPSDSINMLEINKSLNPQFIHMGDILTYISYLFLFEFGRRLLNLTHVNLPWWSIAIPLFIVLAISWFPTDSWTVLDILIGYFIRFPAGLMAGIGFVLYYRYNYDALKEYHVKSYFNITGYALILWAVFCGLVRSKGEFFPANILNIESFFMSLSVPVYVFRSICAILVAIGVTGILTIFSSEGRRQIAESLQRERVAITRHDKNMARIQTRDRIAENLHDEIGATISSISHFAEAVGKNLKLEQESESQKLLSMIICSTREAQGKLKDLIWTINPHNDDWDDLCVKLHRYASDLLDSKDIDYQIDIPEGVSLRPLEMEERQHFWLIFKEIVTNIARHSKCNKTEIEMTLNENVVRLVVSDNGVGFNTETLSDGHGLNNILMRVEKLNGQAELHSEPGAGTQWQLRFKVD